MENKNNIENHGEMSSVWGEKWSCIVADFQREFGNNIYNAWLCSLNLVSLGEFEIVMSVPTNFIRDWINREYFDGVFKKVNGERTCIRSGIKQVLLKYYPKLVSFGIIVDKSRQEKIISDVASEPVSISANNNLYNIGIELNKNYTFENFVVGQSNKIAYQVCNAVADGDSTKIETNPLFLYGSVGLGKTHLCQAVAWKLREKNKSKQIVYLSAEKFMFLFVQALQGQSINDFKNRFRNVDTLIIDDIQFIIGKDKTQREFFYTFETLTNENKQIILACDRSPTHLEGLDEKLKSRLNGGLIVDIREPDYQLKLGIVRKKSVDLGLVLTNELMEFIAEKIACDGREIDGCLKRLQINQNIMQVNITKEDVEDILSDNICQNQKVITIDLIQKKVVEYFDISLNDLKSEKRLKNLVTPRHIAMYLSKKLT
ncbi:MAG: chromosomal replication initiator protein DnaA, partial [Rickettsiales bacterium]|nr:chromosomal replication initiator protein DnaA [Rickettsiales bacterium]